MLVQALTSSGSTYAVVTRCNQQNRQTNRLAHDSTSGVPEVKLTVQLNRHILGKCPSEHHSLTATKISWFSKNGPDVVSMFSPQCACWRKSTESEAGPELFASNAVLREQRNATGCPTAVKDLTSSRAFLPLAMKHFKVEKEGFALAYQGSA